MDGIPAQEVADELGVGFQHIYKLFGDPIRMASPTQDDGVEIWPREKILKHVNNVLKEYPEPVAGPEQDRPEANPNRPNYCIDVNPAVHIRAPWYERWEFADRDDA
ncbi:MAG TPA: hypothetical protein VM537_10525 [Anaerolineae bacterium]|nr:hypothetical protein [Anaerolineae bacterium]